MRFTGQHGSAALQRSLACASVDLTETEVEKIKANFASLAEGDTAAELAEAEAVADDQHAQHQLRID